MKKNGSFVLKLIFGLMGAIYAVIGVTFLVVAMKEAGDVTRIFTLPEEKLAFAIVGTVFTVLGAGFLIAALGVMLAGKRQQRIREELMQYGTRVTGIVIEVWVNHSVRVNGRSPLLARVQCTFPTGDITLKSKNLWNVCPSTGDAVEVIYDPMDEKRYVIEFEGE